MPPPIAKFFWIARRTSIDGRSDRHPHRNGFRPRAKRQLPKADARDRLSGQTNLFCCVGLRNCGSRQKFGRLMRQSASTAGEPLPAGTRCRTGTTRPPVPHPPEIRKAPARCAALQTFMPTSGTLQKLYQITVTVKTYLSLHHLRHATQPEQIFYHIVTQPLLFMPLVW